MRNSLAWLVVLVALPLAPAQASAQLGTSGWSMELGTRLGTTTIYELAMRRHAGTSTAFRLGLQASLNKQDGDGTRQYPGNPDFSEESSSQQNTAIGSIEWMHFASIRNNVTATFTAGPFVQYARSAYRDEYAPGTDSFRGQEYKSETATLGLELLLGAEWHFTDRFSLGGAAGVRGHAGARHEVQINREGTGALYIKYEDQMESNVTILETVPTKIYLSTYF